MKTDLRTGHISRFSTLPVGTSFSWAHSWLFFSSTFARFPAFASPADLVAFSALLVQWQNLILAVVSFLQSRLSAITTFAPADPWTCQLDIFLGQCCSWTNSQMFPALKVHFVASLDLACSFSFVLRVLFQGDLCYMDTEHLHPDPNRCRY